MVCAVGDGCLLCRPESRDGFSRKQSPNSLFQIRKKGQMAKHQNEVRQTPDQPAGWSPYEVWLTRVHEPRAGREGPAASEPHVVEPAEAKRPKRRRNRLGSWIPSRWFATS